MATTPAFVRSLYQGRRMACQRPRLSEWRDLGLAAAPPLLSWPSRQVTASWVAIGEMVVVMMIMILVKSMGSIRGMSMGLCEHI